MNDYSKLLKAGREVADMSVREAGRLARISNAYLNQMENGKIKEPSPVMLKRISKIYDIPYDILLEKAGYPVPDFNIDAGAEHLNVLVIDDNPADREILKRHLGKKSNPSFTVAEADTGQAGLAMCTSGIHDSVLLDYNLPDLNGLEFMDELRKHEIFNRIAVIIVTGAGSETIAVNALKKGAVDYLIKDQISADRLVKAIQYGRRIMRFRSLNMTGLNFGMNYSAMIEKCDETLSLFERFEAVLETMRKKAGDNDPEGSLDELKKTADRIKESIHEIRSIGNR